MNDATPLTPQNYKLIVESFARPEAVYNAHRRLWRLQIQNKLNFITGY